MNGLSGKGCSSEEIKELLKVNNLPIHYMSGTNGMLPPAFIYDPPNKKDRIHQSQKPKDLYIAIEKYITNEFERIIDQFAGSCVLGEASLEINRNSILFEIDKNIVDSVIEYYESKDLNFSKIEDLEELEYER